MSKVDGQKTKKNNPRANPKPTTSTRKEEATPPQEKGQTQEGTKESFNSVKEETICLNDLRHSLEYPCSIGMIGKKFSGKSNLILNLIDKKKFDNVFVVTQSYHTGNLDDLVSDPDNVLPNIDDHFINIVTEWQQENPDSKTLIVFDDFIDSERTLRKIPLINKLASSGRNFNVSLIFSSQSHSALPPIIRKNLEYLFFGRNLYQSIKSISDEWATHDKPPKQLQQELTQLSKGGRHDWMYYNDRNSEWHTIPQEQIEVFI